MKRRLRLGALLLAILTVAALLAGCSNVNDGGNESSVPDSTTVTEKPDERLDLAAYSLIRPDRSSGYLTDAFRGLRNNIRERFGIDLTVSDDWLLEGDYDSERVAALPEVLVGNVNRPEAKKTAEGIGKNEWRISRAGAKIVISGGSELALGAAMNAFFEALSGMLMLCVYIALSLYELREFIAETEWELQEQNGAGGDELDSIP